MPSLPAFPLYHPAALGDALKVMDKAWRAFAANLNPAK
jgi:hypothetical protein